MKELTGNIHMSRSFGGGGNHGASIEITDKASGLIIAELSLSPEQVGALIIGYPTNCRIKLYAEGPNYGKKEEIRHEHVQVPEGCRNLKGDEWKAVWETLTRSFEVDGWTADFDTYRSRQLEDKGYPVTLRRYVDAPVAVGG